jgi:CRISPR system Cascade subunit CasB
MSELANGILEEGGAKGRKHRNDGAKAREWWERLQPSKNSDEHARGGDRAALARLRRCATWMEAAAEAETALLFRRTGLGDEMRLPRVAVLAVVLAHVRSDETLKIASSIGPQGGDEAAALLSPLRLRRLLTTEGDDALLTAFRRLVALKGGSANVADLAQQILNWQSERTRMRFAFDYWQAGQAAPSDVLAKNGAHEAADA